MKKIYNLPARWIWFNNITGYLFRLKLTQIITKGKEIIQILSGITPLKLSNAVSKNIINLIQYGKVIQNGTPTPDAPVDLLCNNGALRMVHRSGLPSGYKLLEYVGGSGLQYIITDVYLASTDVVECEFRNSTTTGYGAVYGVFKLGESSALYGNQTYYGYNAANDKVNTGIPVDTEWHLARHDFVNGTLTVDDTTVTFTPFEFVNSTQNAVLSRYYNNSYGYNWKGYIRKFKVTRNGEVVCDLLPAKNSNDVAGLYDLATGNFYTATGGDLLEGNEIDDYEFRIVGTPEVLSVGGLNLFYNDEAWEQGFYLTSGKVASATANRTFVMRCSPNTTYYWKHCSLVGGVRAFTVDGDTVEDGVDGTWIKQNPVIGKINEVYSATTGADAKWLCVCFGRNEKAAAPIADQWSDFMLSTIPLTVDTPYKAYKTTQTASVSNLYAVGDYKDEQDIISGAVTRKVGVKVLDGTEEWTKLGSVNGYYIRIGDMKVCNPPINGLSSHFIGTNASNASMPDGSVKNTYTNATEGVVSIRINSAETVEDFKAFLAAQYAAGTPVIVMYPLAEETTESVTPQPLRTEAGDNTVSVVSEVGSVELSVKYYVNK